MQCLLTFGETEPYKKLSNVLKDIQLVMTKVELEARQFDSADSILSLHLVVITSNVIVISIIATEPLI